MSEESLSGSKFVYQLVGWPIVEERTWSTFETSERKSQYFYGALRRQGYDCAAVDVHAVVISEHPHEFLQRCKSVRPGLRDTLEVIGAFVPIPKEVYALLKDQAWEQRGRGASTVICNGSDLSYLSFLGRDRIF